MKKSLLLFGLIVYLCSFFISMSSASADAPRYQGRFRLPYNGTSYITRAYNLSPTVHPVHGDMRPHKGDDLAGGSVYGGSPVLAIGEGYATSGWENGYGNWVEINHGGGITSLYGHNSSVVIPPGGKQVRAGEVIAYAGTTGQSTGVHIHLEIAVNGSQVRPGLFIPELYAMEQAWYDGNGITPSGGMAGMPKMVVEAIEDFAKPIYDVVDKMTETISKAIKLIREYIAQIFFVLIVIDLALEAMRKTQGILSYDGDGRDPLVRWLIQKCLFYALCFFILFNWSDVVGNFAMSGFPQLGAYAGGAENVDTAQATLADPTMIVQKGMSIIVPIINKGLEWETGDFLLAMVGVGQISNLLSLIFGMILFALFCIIGIQIAIVYLEFYFVILFSFTSFTFAGVRQVRRYASNGLNGVFAVSINLMFFTLFALMLTTMMEDLAVDNLIQQTEAKTSADQAAAANIRTVDDLMREMRRVESGGQYHIGHYDGGTTRVGYGAYGHTIAYWDKWASDYVANGGVLDTDGTGYTRYVGTGATGDESEPTETTYPMSPANQDAVTRYLLEGLYAEHGDWRLVALSWNGGNSDAGRAAAERQNDYWGRISGSDGGMRVVSVINMILLLKLTLLVLMFIFFADRIHKLIMTQFGQAGFKLTNEQ